MAGVYANMEELATAHDTLELRVGELEEQKPKWDEMKEKLNALEVELDYFKWGKGDWSKGDSRNLVDSKGFLAVSKYTGKAEEFDDWQFKIRSLLEKERPGFIELFQYLEKVKEIDIKTNDDFKDQLHDKGNVDWYQIDDLNEQLYQVLVQKVEGNALATVKHHQNDKGHRGVISWHKILISAKGANQMRSHELTKRVTNPTKVANIEAFIPAFERWEALVQEFESSEGPVPTTIKQQALKQLTPEEITQDIKRLPGLDDYKSLKEYIMEKVTERREPFFEEVQSKKTPAPGAHRLEEETEEECADAAYGLNEMICHGCNGWGHRVSQCPTKDRMIKEKQGAEGGKKGDSKGRKGQPKGYWGGQQQEQPWPGKGGYGEQQPWKGGFGGKGKSKGGKGEKGKGKAPWYQNQYNGSWNTSWSSPYGKGSGKSPAYGCEWDQAETASEGTWGGAYCFNIEVEGVSNTGQANTAPEILKTQPLAKTIVSNSFQAIEPHHEEGELDILNVDEAEWPTCQTKSPPKVEKPKMTKIHRKTQKERRQVTFEDSDEMFWQDCDELYAEKEERKEKARWESCGPINFLDTIGGELSNVSQTNESEWVEVKSVVDSGATKCVAPRSLADQIPIKESEASKRGLSFQGAGGEKIRNYGTRTIPAMTNEWLPLEMMYDVADVVKPLNSVSQICDGDNTVIFTKHGGWIQNNRSQNVISFPRVSGVYEMTTWIPRKAHSGPETVFTRQTK